MFDNLSQKLTAIFDGIRSKGTLTPSDVDQALRELRIGLLEADVALPAAKALIESIRPKAIGENILKSLTPGQMVIKVIEEELVTFLSSTDSDLDLNAQPPISIMFVGVQGSGKTTSTAKLAHFLRKNYKKKVLLSSVDVYRPAAQKQLEILANQLGIDFLECTNQEKPEEIAKRGLEKAKREGYDILLVDTAGRFQVDDDLMDELSRLKNLLHPKEILFVADATTGQEALPIAKAFHEKIQTTGAILTRLDGDARGGAALSIRYTTGVPIKFMGLGEKTDALEKFDAKRMVNRILDMGDILGLIEKASEMANEEDMQKEMEKFQRGEFNLNDMKDYLQKMIKMGGMKSILGLLPGMKKIQKELEDKIDDKLVKRQIGIIQSMTEKERKLPNLLNASRRKRIAAGCGMTVTDVNKLMKQFEQTQQMMKRFKKLGGKFSLSNLMR